MVQLTIFKTNRLWQKFLQQVQRDRGITHADSTTTHAQAMSLQQQGETQELIDPSVTCDDNDA